MFPSYSALQAPPPWQLLSSKLLCYSLSTVGIAHTLYGGVAALSNEILNTAYCKPNNFDMRVGLTLTAAGVAALHYLKIRAQNNLEPDIQAPLEKRIYELALGTICNAELMISIGSIALGVFGNKHLLEDGLLAAGQSFALSLLNLNYDLPDEQIEPQHIPTKKPLRTRKAPQPPKTPQPETCGAPPSQAPSLEAAPLKKCHIPSAHFAAALREHENHYRDERVRDSVVKACLEERLGIEISWARYYQELGKLQRYSKKTC